jgi:hydroxymethylbilane synthase
MKLKLAARKSDLARLQALTVGQVLCSKNPDLQIEYLFSASLGDKNLTDPLWQMPDKGVFTSDLTQGLIQGQHDFVVHSWKDLPTEVSPLTEIIATLPREDVRDLFLFRPESINKKDLVILSSSPRREYNNGPFITSVLPWENSLQFKSVRGNIPTRIEKLIDGEGDGLFVAKAAIDRLLSSQENEFASVRKFLRSALAKLKWMVMPISYCPTAAAQGALAIEILKSRKDLAALFKKINDPKTFDAVLTERKILKSYGGGCHQKIGVNILPHAKGTILSLRGKTDAGEELQKFQFQEENYLQKFMENELFPLTMTENKLFTDEEVSFDQSLLQNKDLFIAKWTAWPVSYRPLSNQLIWASGIRSWQKLAKIGVWVNGCSDGLGEEESLHLDILANRTPTWLRLTHMDADHMSMGKNKLNAESLGTYQLKLREPFPDLRQKRSFYWSSFNHFQAAVKRFPEIKKYHHAAGPGKTFDKIKEALGEQGQLSVFISQKRWLQVVKK